MKHLKWVALLLFLWSISYAVDTDVTADSCPSPKECIAKIDKILDRDASPGRYPSRAEQAIIKKLLEFGDDAMPLIVQLLENKDELIARIGAVALTNAKSIDKKYLPQIVRGLKRDVSWLAPALARVGTPKAAEIAVQKFLTTRSSPHNQEAVAIQLFGKKIFPAVLKAVKCGFGCNDQTYYLLGFVLGEMDEQRADAAKLLIGVAEDSSQPEKIRKGVLHMISYLDKPALIIESKLLRIKKMEPGLTGEVNRALIGIKSRHAGKIYAEMLAKTSDVYILRDIAELGAGGNDAGKPIANLLNSKDMEKRREAARTLGFIEYTPAAPRLMQLLNEPSDVILNWVAAESLGRMKSQKAIPALRDAAQNHWYPPVREAAKKAVEYIQSGKTYKNKFHRNNFLFDYFSYEHFDMGACKNITIKARHEPKDQKLYPSYANQKLKSLAYPAVILGYGAKDEEQQKKDNPGGIIEVNNNNIVEYRHPIKQVPTVALRTKGGWLAGSDRGEWGGELVYIPDNAKAFKILDENIENIYQFGGQYIVITGLAHLMTNEGLVYKLFRDEAGVWHAEVWRVLPGAPRSSGLVETGEIVIHTVDGGSILLSKNGSMRMATCK